MNRLQDESRTMATSVKHWICMAVVLALLAPALGRADDSKSMCDRLAADPGDPDKSPGLAGVAVILFENAEAALRACEKAVEEEPANARYLFQRARAIEARDREFLGNAIPAFETAARAGSSAAMAELGSLYMSMDFERAKVWFEMAAAKGNARAMRNLGDIYREGLGVAADKVSARQWYEKAAESGDEESSELLKSLPK